MAKKKILKIELEAGDRKADKTKPKSAKDVKIAPAKGRPMLNWVGKKSLDSVRTYPAQLAEAFHGNNDEAEPNLLFHGDNKEVLAYLLTNGYRGQVDLIYIDPPFDSKADYVRKVELRNQKTTIAGEEQTLIEQIQYSDIWANDTYLQFMYERLILLRELLSPVGSIYLHCDWRKSHHLRILLDEIFGVESFRAQITWRSMTSSGYKGKTSLGKSHADILYYSKGQKFTYNPLFVEMTEEMEARYKHTDDDGRRFKDSYLGDATSETIEDLRKRNLLYVTSKGGNRIKHYLDETKGTYVDDIWTDINVENSQSSALTDYPTQKPETLLNRIVRLSSLPNDLVLDCFVGSGTTAAAAQKLGRRWIGCDINKGAIQTTSKRLQTVIRKQIDATRQGKLAIAQPDDGVVPSPRFSFTHYRINDYDLQVQHNEALELALQHLNVERNRTDGFFDGLLGKKLVRVVPLNHPCTLLDLQLVENELKNRPDEDRDIIVVALGKDANVDGFIADYNKRRKVNKIVIIELRSDPKYGGFFEHQPAWVTLDVKAKTGTAKIDITDFCSPTILERLNLDQTVFREKVTDFRSMIDVVLVDTNYNGKVFNIAFSDAPEKKTDFVKAKYELPIPANSKRIAVKVIDMLGEEVLEVREVK